MRLFTQLIIVWLITYSTLLSLYFVVGRLIEKLTADCFDLKINKDILIPRQEKRLDIRQSVISLFLVSLLLSLGYTLQCHHFGAVIPFHPAAITYPLYFLFSMIAFDTSYYWIHRLLHIKINSKCWFLNKHSSIINPHTWHHRNRHPSVWTSHSNSILDTFFLQSYWLVAFLILPIPPVVLFAHKIIDQIRVIIKHSGYEITGTLPLKYKHLLAVVHQDQHHGALCYNFSLYFSWWDRIAGTLYPDYDRINHEFVRAPQYKKMQIEKINIKIDSALSVVNTKSSPLLRRSLHIFLYHWWYSQYHLTSMFFTVSLKNIQRTLNTANNPLQHEQFIMECQQFTPTPHPICNPNRPIDISIIIPAYNNWEYTSACINSILKTHDEHINYEVILADDNSTDETRHAEKYYPGLIITKTDKNSGFLRNCNHASKKARGRYIALLNNDTIVLQGWLTGLYETIELHTTAAIVGSKILNENGLINESGSAFSRIVNKEPFPIGKGYHSQTPAFNIQRDTVYVSACSILIRKSFWDAVGGFDERFQHGYYEDSDLAMTARSLGLRVIYQPKSEVIHFEGKSYTIEGEEKQRRIMKANQKLFLEKWSKNFNHQAIL
ncbi:MAG: glycosyltransferase [Gammaproteobacteria bacterium]|nr:glycosyltransferase [Gammaproteobacteria bacterium]